MELLTQKTGKRIFFQKSVFTVLLALVTVFACDFEDPIPTYTLTTSVSPNEGGKITLSPELPNYKAGEVVTLTPEPNEHWVFKQWDGDATGNTTPLQISMNTNKSITGVFVKRDYPLNIKIEGQGTVEEKIIPNPSGREYPHGTRVELKPIPKEGWVFESWGGDLSGNETPQIITVDKEKNVIVKFKRRDYPLTITITGEGTVEEKIVSSPGGKTYPFETVVELKPVPKLGWVFESWGGDLTGNEVPKNINVDKEKNVTVKFKRKDYPLNVTISGEGTVEEKIVSSPGGRSYPYQTVVELAPKPKEGWVFEGWSGDLTGNEAPKNITVDKEKNVTAKFRRRDYPLNLTIEGEGLIEEKIVSSPGDKTYPFQTVVELTPKPKDGWIFESWGGDLTGNEVPKTITVDKEKNVSAKFVRKEFKINYTFTGEGTVEEKIISIPGNRTYPFQTVVELTPKPNFGWEFESWGGDLSGSETPKTITIDSEKNVSVKFKLRFQIDIISEPTVAEGFIKGARIASDRSLYFIKNNVETIISGGVQWFNNPQHKVLPLIQFKRIGNNWEFGGELGSVEMNAFRNWEFLEDGSGFVICETGPEWPDIPWPHGNIYVAKYLGSDLRWIKVNETKSFYHDVSAGDINNDGIIDILGTHMGTRSDNIDNPHIYLGKADGSYQELKNVLTDLVYGGDVDVFDINGDGLKEIILSGTDDYRFENYTYFKYNQNSKTFTKHILFQKPINQSISLDVYEDSRIKRNQTENNFKGYMPKGKRFVDFNNDGKMDIVQERDGLTIWYNLGNGDYNSVRVNSQGVQDGNQLPIFPNYNMSGYEIIDLESDGDPDLIPIILNFGNQNNLTEIDLQRMIYFNDGGRMKRLSSDKYKISKQSLGGQAPSTLQPIIRNGKLCFRGVLDMFSAPSFNNIRYLTIFTDINASYYYD
jgi:uncharacterized repeat protein (TIGR02543 family)